MRAWRMGLRAGRGPQSASGGAVYWQKVRGLFGSAVVGYWPLNELSGSAAYDVSGNLLNGAHSGVSLANADGPKGGMAPLYDGVNDYTSINAAAAAFNGAEGSLLIFARVSGAGVWADATIRWLARIAVDDNNRVEIYKHSDANRLFWRHSGGGTSTTVNITSHSPTAWTHYGMTWSLAANEMKAYLNGAQYGATQGGVGAWAGTPGASLTRVGMGNGTGYYSGWLAHALLLNRPATGAEIGQVYSWT
jgi:hypothetical protein